MPTVLDLNPVAQDRAALVARHAFKVAKLSKRDRVASIRRA